jgi:hypothetical protein
MRNAAHRQSVGGLLTFVRHILIGTFDSLCC